MAQDVNFGWRVVMDIKKLKVDESLWPEGATHIIDDVFTKWVHGVEFDYYEDIKDWRKAGLQYSLQRYLDELDHWSITPRPQKPEGEWDGSEMVKAGHRLEARADGNPWLRGEITYRSEEGVVFRPDDAGCELFWRFCMFDVEFRPIRTKEQRQVFDLECVIQKAYEKGDGGVDFNEFAKAIIAAGWKKDV